MESPWISHSQINKQCKSQCNYIVSSVTGDKSHWIWQWGCIRLAGRQSRCRHKEMIKKIQRPGIQALLSFLWPISSLDSSLLIFKLKCFSWMIIKLSSNPEESIHRKERKLIKVIVSFTYLANHWGEWGGKVNLRLNSETIIELKIRSTQSNS